ncbi:MAG: hypothetical protein WCV00_10170 [Verrucomicrobiia bacterium]|jgi:hypothetical protein
MDEGSQFLAVELDRLMKVPLGNKSDVAAWYQDAGRVQRSLVERFPTLEFPHEVWHFFADADIRARDAEYRLRQEQVIADYIKKVRGVNHSV